MKDVALYQQILGVAKPWIVSEVNMDVPNQTIEVGLSLAPDAIWACPACKARMHIKEWRERRWRHLDSCQFKIALKAKVPVVECPEHGSQTVQVPWAEGKSRFTLFFERLAIEVLLACAAKKAAELLDISWDKVDGIKQRAVRRGLGRRTLEGLEYVCVDEKAVGFGHDYIVVTGVLGGKRHLRLNRLNFGYSMTFPSCCALTHVGNLI